ncbi:hypothetical protein ACFWN1_12100 [Streptomyces sp. NPDC058459]|uniref:hypothetical protein n=1 Tax=Streptomyces sp. NPDC058459 TaxID=3346508 RepID=UPI0036480580
MVTATSSAEHPQYPDFGASLPWGGGHWDHLNRFRQGHLITGIPVVFLGAANSSMWAAETESIRENLTEALNVVLEKGSPLRYGMITTQGCDILKPDMPWIGVVPVYDASLYFDRGKLGLISANRMTHILPILPPWRQTDEKWVADLRLEVPVEKSTLLDRQPIEAYEAEEHYANVSERLGSLRRRAAVPEACLQHVVQPLYDYVRAQDEDVQDQMLASVHETRIWQDLHDVPTRAQLFIILKDDLLSTHDRDAWDEAFAHVYGRAAEAGITLLPTRTVTYDSLSARDLLRSLPVTERGTS